MIKYKQEVKKFSVKDTAERRRLDKAFNMGNQKHYGDKLATSFPKVK